MHTWELCIKLSLLSCLLPGSLSAGENPGFIGLANDHIALRIERHGGHFTGLTRRGNALNPLSWALTPGQMPPNNRNGAPFKGHFLCLGRWGAPSDAEIAAGIPHNGEQSNTMWTVRDLSSESVTMSNTAPLDGLSVVREVALIKDEPAFLVVESFTNTFPLGRVSNVVQHVTIGAPFLSTQTLTNTNAGKGFNQSFSYPDPHAREYAWPFAIVNDETDTTIDLRLTSADQDYVSTHLLPETDVYGWVTAYDPRSGLLLGYVWRQCEYPWINIWNHCEDGQPSARGLEFGTTGIGRPYRELLETDTRFHGVNSWEYIDAGETKTKSFVGFLVDHGPDRNNPVLSVTDDQIRINGREFIRNPLGTEAR